MGRWGDGDMCFQEISETLIKPGENGDSFGKSSEDHAFFANWGWRDGEWRGGEMGGWEDGGMARWGDGVVARWGDGEMGRWGGHVNLNKCLQNALRTPDL